MGLTFTLIDFMILLLGGGMLVYCTILIDVYGRKWYLIFPLLFWAIHTVIFYSFLTYGRLIGVEPNRLFITPDVDDIWSTVLRLHGIVTLYYVCFLLSLEIIPRRRKNE